ncbi:hypothetical protein EMIT048CA2_20123 [Pseudomonas chlororaphis]
MTANSASGCKQTACDRLSHRHSRLSPHQQPNARLNPVPSGCRVKKGAMVPALAGCWKGKTAKGCVSALYLCVAHFLCVFLVRWFVLQMGGAVTFWRKAINLKDLRSSAGRLRRPRRLGACNILAQILRKK